MTEIKEATSKEVAFSKWCPEKIIKPKFYVHQKYVIEVLNMSQIARELFTSRQTIRARLLKMGVELRSSIDQLQNQKHTKFGHKRIRAKTLRKKSEERVAHAITEMREKGGAEEWLEMFILKSKVTYKLMQVTYLLLEKLNNICVSKVTHSQKNDTTPITSPKIKL